MANGNSTMRMEEKRKPENLLMTNRTAFGLRGMKADKRKMKAIMLKV